MDHYLKRGCRVEDAEYYKHVPYPGGRIVDRVAVNGLEQPWPTGAIRYVKRRWLGPVHIRTQGVEFIVRYVGVHEHARHGFYPMHTHPHSEMLYTLDGTGTIHLPDRKRSEECVAGRLLVLPPGTAHQSAWTVNGDAAPWRLLVVNFDLVIDVSQIPQESGETIDMAFTPFYEWFYIRQGVGLTVGDPERAPVTAILNEVAASIAESQYGICSDVIACLMRAISLFSRGIRRNGLSQGNAIAPSLISKESALLKAKVMMEQGCHQQDTRCILHVAQAVGMSESHFIREFKRAYGTTPKQYSIDVLMRRAASMLARTDMTVKNVTYFLGFADPSSFTRMFSRYHGMTPKEYQRSHSGQAT
ncbi:MAG TPA: helix-turn-helix domain-containing protein [Kiritimatiellia bacterium]|nr:helix-turn-helix domain-containing protein [Kiritimatiellia bacterium]HMP34497.1 helix-turn-helix domain-containing protein [Kiritimatiellia bacterium]